MNDDNTKDAAEPSPASGGSHGDTGIISWEQADQIMQEQRAEIARMRLSDEEREAIACGIDAIRDRFEGYDECEPLQATLRRLLERL